LLAKQAARARLVSKESGSPQKGELTIKKGKAGMKFTGFSSYGFVNQASR